jgi:hypothetical protein
MLIRHLVRPIVSPLVRGVTQRTRGKADPTMQVAAMAPRAWYERANLTSLYQDGPGATPVTAAGQPVGRGLSRDQGVERGAERVINGVFASDTGWTKGTGWSISGGMARINGTNTGSSLLTAAAPLANMVVGTTYEGLFDYASTSGRLRFNPVVGNAGALVASGSSGRYSSFFVATGDPTSLAIQAPDANTVATISLVSVKPAPGNHQVQATASLKPLYQVGPKRLVFDGTDDVLTTTFAAALGSSCTIGRAIPGTGAVITTGVTVGTTFADNVSAAALVIFDRALTAGETAALTAYLNLQLA